MKKSIFFLLVLAILGLIIFSLLSFTKILSRSNLPLEKVNIIDEIEIPAEDIPRVSVIADNLMVPWAIAFLPDRKILVTERNGGVKLIDGDNVKKIADIDVVSTSESGLHGVAIDPDFSDNNFIYLYYTTRPNGENTLNRVSRFFLDDELTLRDEKIIIDNIPGAPRHDGGRIKFGPDGYLYIATGDATEPSLSQDRNSLAGKILRVDKGGGTPADNPFGNPIFSYGHRNPQGLAWDNNGNLFSTEHGNSATDEFNAVEMGDNYGWPLISGNMSREQMHSPLVQSGNDTWAPAGLAFIDDKFYFGGLRGNALYRVEKVNDEYLVSEYFKGEFGRIREVIVGPDDMLYITTSNTDGRGIPSGDDDKIIRINPAKL